jgi:hypothetical protein
MDTPLSGNCLQFLTGLQRLRSFHFSFSVDDDGLRCLAQLPELQIRTIRVENVTDSGMSYLAGFGHLETLTVRRAELGAEGFQIFRKCISNAANSLRTICISWLG